MAIHFKDDDKGINIPVTNSDVNLDSVRSEFSSPNTKQSVSYGFDDVMNSDVRNDNVIDVGDILKYIEDRLNYHKKNENSKMINSTTYKVYVLDNVKLGLCYSSIIIAAKNEDKVTKYFDIVLEWTNINSVTVLDYINSLSDNKKVHTPDDSLAVNHPEVHKYNIIKENFIMEDSVDCVKTGHCIAKLKYTENDYKEIVDNAMNSFGGSQSVKGLTFNGMLNKNKHYFKFNFNLLPLSNSLNTWQMDMIVSTGERVNTAFNIPTAQNKNFCTIKGYTDVVPEYVKNQTTGATIIDNAGNPLIKFHPLIVVTDIYISGNRSELLTFPLLMASTMASNKYYMHDLLREAEKDPYGLKYLNRVAKRGGNPEPINFKSLNTGLRGFLEDWFSLDPIVCFDVESSSKDSYLKRSIGENSFKTITSDFLNTKLHNEPLYNFSILPAGYYKPNGQSEEIDIRKISYINLCKDSLEQDLVKYYKISQAGYDAYGMMIYLLRDHYEYAVITGKYKRCYLNIHFLNEICHHVAQTGFKVDFNMPEYVGELVKTYDYNNNFGSGSFYTSFGNSFTRNTIENFGF